MTIRAIRLCHHCCVELSDDELLHYVFECHACVLTDHELEAAVRRDPNHPDAERLTRGPVDRFHGTRTLGAARTRTGTGPRSRAA